MHTVAHCSVHYSVRVHSAVSVQCAIHSVQCALQWQCALHSERSVRAHSWFTVRDNVQGQCTERSLSHVSSLRTHCAVSRQMAVSAVSAPNGSVSAHTHAVTVHCPHCPHCPHCQCCHCLLSLFMVHCILALYVVTAPCTLPLHTVTIHCHCALSLYTVHFTLYTVLCFFLEGVDGNLSPPLCSPLTRTPPPQLQPEAKEQLQPQ